jgi:hypothetical protein
VLWEASVMQNIHLIFSAKDNLDKLAYLVTGQLYWALSIASE